MEPLTEEEEALIKQVLPKYAEGHLARSVPNGYVLPSRVDMEAVADLEVYEDDIFIVTPAKSGTTWTQEIVWLMLNDVDLEGAKVNQFYRVPFIEIHGIIPPDPRSYPEGEPKNQENRVWFQAHSLEYIRRQKRPRIIKTHLPLSLLPKDVLQKKCKVIFVARNPKDVSVSLFYHFGLRDGLNCQDNDLLEHFVRLFMKGGITWTPIVPMTLEAWQMRRQSNVLFYTYEQMQSNLDGVLDKLMKFLGVTLTEEKLQQLKDAVSFGRIKTNPYVNKADELGASFIRKGVVGDWKNHFTPEFNKEFDEWLEQQLKGSDFKYVMELR